jgi:hypothetical protein
MLKWKQQADLDQIKFDAFNTNERSILLGQYYLKLQVLRASVS